MPHETAYLVIYIYLFTISGEKKERVPIERLRLRNLKIQGRNTHETVCLFIYLFIYLFKISEKKRVLIERLMKIEGPPMLIDWKNQYTKDTQRGWREGLEVQRAGLDPQHPHGG